MDSSQKYFDPQTLAKLQGLELRARRIVEGYVAGMHRSPFHGFSIEFAEHREYAPGDDLRYVDWKVFGRTDKVYLKQYEEETNLLVNLVLDTSSSMQYRSENAALSKLEYAQCLAASLAFLVLRQQDSVGLVTIDNQVRQLIRPSSNPTHAKQLVQIMEQAKSLDKTSLGPIFHDLAERFRQRGVVVILSDLFDDPAPLLAGLKHLRHRRHEVIVMHILDPAELDFPFREATRFKGLEGEDPLLTDPRGLRKAYLAAFDSFRHEIERGCRNQHADYVLLRTDQPLDVALSSFLARRLMRKK